MRAVRRLGLRDGRRDPAAFLFPGELEIRSAATRQLATTDNPAVAGELLQIPCIGLSDGSIIPPRVIIGGVLTELMSSTSADGATGVTRLTVRMPTLVAGGPAVGVVLRYIGRTSNQVMLAAR